MKRTCDDCQTTYDDAVCWTYCPHDRFISDEDKARKDAALALAVREKLLDPMTAAFVSAMQGPARAYEAAALAALFPRANGGGSMLTGLSYRDASDFQLEAWRQGKPWHNPVSPVRRVEGGECCPDFSCCQPHLLADAATREAFVRADERIRHEMLGMFLGSLVASPQRRVHIAGMQTEEAH